MLASAGSSLIRAASPKLAQLAGSAVASYHAIYDVGNSTNIKWWVLQACRGRAARLPAAVHQAVKSVCVPLSLAQARGWCERRAEGGPVGTKGLRSLVSLTKPCHPSRGLLAATQDSSARVSASCAALTLQRPSLPSSVQVHGSERLWQEHSGVHAGARPVRARAPDSSAGWGQHPPRPKQEPGILCRGQVRAMG